MRGCRRAVSKRLVGKAVVQVPEFCGEQAVPGLESHLIWLHGQTMARRITLLSRNLDSG